MVTELGRPPQFSTGEELPPTESNLTHLDTAYYLMPLRVGSTGSSILPLLLQGADGECEDRELQHVRATYNELLASAQRKHATSNSDPDDWEVRRLKHSAKWLRNEAVKYVPTGATYSYQVKSTI